MALGKRGGIREVLRLAAVLLPMLLFAACGAPRMVPGAVEASVREYAQTVAHDITREGLAAWRRHFAESPAFFMASEGHLVFPTSASATAGIHDLTRIIQQIELRWGDDLRVDPLTPDLAVMAASYRERRVNFDGTHVEESGFFTGLVERTNGRWQFRDAHWSVAGPPPKVP